MCGIEFPIFMARTMKAYYPNHCKQSEDTFYIPNQRKED
jgi:hypothetical protein